ncbi:cytochrome P450 oxidoreductase GliF [Aspergillus karnatakaensis]|uniref:cytochrome P450 n=1 Tax=Aspergillus karnatakaensis TaxID=1810916 RepID=UPI003CCD24A1
MLFSDLWEQYHIVQQSLAPLRLTRGQMLLMMFQARHRNASLPERIVVWVLFLWSIYSVCKVAVAITKPKPVYSLGLPILGDSQAANCDLMKVITDARLSTPNAPYIIKTDQFPLVVFPSYMYEEIKKLPLQTASLPAYLSRKFFAPYTLIGRETTALLHSIKIDIARSLPTMAPSRQIDAQQAVKERVGTCSDWTEMEIFPAVLEMISTVNASFFMGRENPEMTRQWSHLSLEFIYRALMGAVAMSYVPELLQFAIAPIAFLPVIVTQWKMRRFLGPTLRAEMNQFRAAESKKRLLTVSEDRKVPFTAALMSRYKPEDVTVRRLADDYTVLAFLTNFAVAVATHLNILDLASRSELVEELRQELREKTVDGALPKSHLAELRKLDSFMRESLRLNAMSLFVLNRIIQSPTKLSIGPSLPAGTAICVDMHHINRSVELWGTPDEFDPLRHDKLRQEEGAEKFQFVAMGPESPLWGDGAMSCPGRLFANSTMKVVLIALIMQYDFKFAEGSGKSAKAAVPEGSWDPDLKARLVLRDRKV